LGKYIKPFCDCGSTLVRVLQPAFDIRIEPLKSGRLPEIKKKDIHLSRVIPDSFPDCLECENCKKEYEFIQDEKGRIIDMWER
jgi:hypothetical protein